MNDETRLQRPGASETTPSADQPERSAPPLPEDTGRTLGPGHIDIVYECLEEARGICNLLYVVIGSGNELPETDMAAMGARRLLINAEQHLDAFYRHVGQERQELMRARDRLRETTGK